MGFSFSLSPSAEEPGLEVVLPEEPEEPLLERSPDTQRRREAGGVGSGRTGARLERGRRAEVSGGVRAQIFFARMPLPFSVSSRAIHPLTAPRRPRGEENRARATVHTGVELAWWVCACAIEHKRRKGERVCFSLRSERLVRVSLKTMATRSSITPPTPTGACLVG